MGLYLLQFRAENGARAVAARQDDAVWRVEGVDSVHALARLAIRLLLNRRRKQRPQVRMLAFQIRRQRAKIPRATLFHYPDDESRQRPERERQQDPQDRRSKRIVLTKSSADMLEAVRQEIDELVRHATQGLNDEEVALFRHFLQTLRDNLQPEQPGQNG